MADSESGYRWARAGRRCTPASRRGSPATLRPRHQEPAGAAGRCAERDGSRDDRRAAPQDHQAGGDRRTDGRQSGSADLRATKMLIDMMKDVEHKALGDCSNPAGWTRRTRR
jgi:hypothetical protein